MHMSTALSLKFDDANGYYGCEGRWIHLLAFRARSFATTNDNEELAAPTSNQLSLSSYGN